MARCPRLARRALLRAVTAAAILSAVPAAVPPAGAQDYPSRPVRLVVAFAPGGTTDFLARLLAEKAKDVLGQTIVVENKPGGNGAIAADYVAKSDPDGYTVFFTTAGAVAINPNLKKTLSYDPVKDFAPVGMMARASTLLVVDGALPVRDARDLVAMEKAKPGSVAIGVTAVGSNSDISVALFEAAAGLKFQHIPYRGAAHALGDVLGGRVQAMSAEIPVLMTQLRAGKIKAVGIFSAQRSEIFPDLPTFAELGFPGALAENWQAVFAPARTPPQVIAKLSRAFRAAIDDPDVQARLIQVGVTPQPGGPEELGTTLRGEIDRYGRLLREHNIQAQTE